MKVSNVSKQSFGRLKINVDKDLLRFAPIKKELAQLKEIFKENGFSRKKNVDVILDYDSFQRKFVGIIESKKQGTPNNPNYKKEVSVKAKDIKAFENWLNEWDYAYSPKGLKEWKELQEQAAKKMFEIHNSAKEAIKRHKEMKAILNGEQNKSDKGFHILSFWR